VPTGHVFRTGSQAPPEPEAPEPDDELPEILLP